MTAYYNEIDPYAAQWLRNLIAAGHIAPGDVDERSILDVSPDDLRGYTQCHFFAGIGVWSHAARLAGLADDFPLWTGSCPCQPFSAAGRRKGFDDDRHLWPVWFDLIRQCRPAVVFGEQVASKDGLGWLDTVHADLEGAGYAVGAADLCAAGVGVGYEETQAYEWLQRAIQDCPDVLLAAELRDFADWACGALGDNAPHIRQRLWFVADAAGGGWERRPVGQGTGGRAPVRVEAVGHDGHGGATDRPGHAGGAVFVEHSAGNGRQQGGRHSAGGRAPSGSRQDTERRDASPTNGFWADADWLPCRDGKARPVEPGSFPLAHGATARVGRLRAYGNAIVAPVAAEFIGAWLDAVSECAPAEWEAAA